MTLATCAGAEVGEGQEGQVSTVQGSLQHRGEPLAQGPLKLSCRKLSGRNMRFSRVCGCAWEDAVTYLFFLYVCFIIKITHKLVRCRDLAKIKSLKKQKKKVTCNLIPQGSTVVSSHFGIFSPSPYLYT